MDPLHRLGWSPSLAAAFEPLRLADPSLVPARVASDHRESLRVLLASGEERIAAPSGRLRHTAAPGGLPVAGDWVALEVPPGGGAAVVHAVLPRRTVLSRREAGEGAVGAQLLAAQVDTVFVAAPLDREVRPRLLERALALAWEGGADPVVLLTKSDLDPDPAGRAAAAEAACPGARVLAVSASTGAGVEALGEWLLPGRTVVLLGPSGAGKSTLANRLLGADLLEIGEVRAEDQRGRHTTVARRLVV
ncbi:MAG TPA: GTPase RsgA, partial [Planctomycetota bacterium]|nr:GTPase RsgA [Planctomycetota bacterium]